MSPVSYRNLSGVLSEQSITVLLFIEHLLDSVLGAVRPLRSGTCHWQGESSESDRPNALVPPYSYFEQLFDNYGPKWLLLIGTFLHVFGLMMTSISKEYYQFFLAQGICSPLGASFVFSPALSCTATWFEKRRALAFGVVSSGSSLGGVVFPTMLSRLLPTIGFGWTIRIAGFIVLALLVVANLTVRSRIVPVPRPVRFTDYTSPFSEAPFVLLMLASCCGFFAMFVPINYIVLEAQEDGVSRDLAGYLLTILNAAR